VHDGLALEQITGTDEMIPAVIAAAVEATKVAYRANHRVGRLPAVRRARPPCLADDVQSMTYIARIVSLVLMASTSPTGWTFLTSHARVLLCIAQDPGMRLREIGQRVGITERAVHRVVGDLAEAGYLSRERHGRRNRYTINSNRTLPDPVARRQRVGDLLAVLTEPSPAPPGVDAAPATS
jgi:hypothetical protein